MLGTRRRAAYNLYLQTVLVPRQLTARWRHSPDFVVIGAQKCGTASLFEYLADHPRVGRALKKEVGFFNLHHHRGEHWYRAFFPLRVPGRVTGEASPDYVFDPAVPERMYRFDPTLRLILLLRDPVERTWSHYRHNVRHGVESRTFEQALMDEDVLERRIDGDRRANREMLHRERYYFYRARGRYHEQLAEWLRLFPREQLLVLLSEDLFRDPAATFGRVLDYLGLPPISGQRFEVHNEGSGRRGVDPDVADRLSTYFAPHNAALAEMLGWPETPWESHARTASPRSPRHCGTRASPRATPPSGSR